MTEEPDNLVGQVLAGTYRLERRLVFGGMAAVYAGRHLRTGGQCAVKVLYQHAVSNTEIYERFQDEARISSTLRHPNIVQVIDLNQTDDGTPFLVMELLEGEDLHDRLERRRRLPLPDVLELVRQVGSALHAAHCREVVHRDLKPQNIFLARSDVNGGVSEVAKLLDFGLSKFRRPSSRVTRDLLVLGTPKYMSPEAALGQNSQLDGRSDQFSLAVIAYRALCGRAPFDSEDVAEVLRQVVYDEPPPLGALQPELPPYVGEAITRAMRKDKHERFDLMLDFVRAICGDGEAKEAGLSWPASAPVPEVRGEPSLSILSEEVLRQAGMGAGEAPSPGFQEAPTFIAELKAPEPVLPSLPRSDPGAASLPKVVYADPAQLDLEDAPSFRWGRLLLAFAGGAVLSLPLLLLVLGNPLSPDRRGAARGAHAARRGGQGPGIPGPAAFEPDPGAAASAAARATAAGAMAPTWARATPATTGAATGAPSGAPSEATTGTAIGGAPAGAGAAVAAAADPGGPAGLPPEAEGAHARDDCRDYYRHVFAALRRAPRDPALLAARWRPCGPPPAPPEPAAPTRAPGYPPLRPLLGEMDAAPPMPQDAAELVRAAQMAFDQGALRRAVALAHAALGQGPVADAAAYRVLGAAACGLGALRVVASAHAALDPFQQAFVEEACLAQQSR